MIFFVVAKKDQGSAILRGIQISEELNKLKVESEVILESKIPNHVVNSIFVWVKHINPNKVKQLSKNKHIYDVVDNYIYQKDLVNQIIENRLVCHFIVNNEYMKSEICNQTKLATNFVSVIPHHWDPRILNTRKENQSNLTFGYLGSVVSLKHTDNFLHYQHLLKKYAVRFYDTELGKDVSSFVKDNKEIAVKRNPDAMKQLKIHFNCHISIRQNNTAESLYKTSAKVVTASALDHNIITTYEQATKDVLPNDYPFILKKTDLESVIKMFDLVKDDYNDKKILWKHGLEIMKTLKDKMSLSKITKNYLFMINTLY